MGISNSNKEISTSKIECGGDFRVKLTLTAQPDITANPTDIVLVLDRSGSMSGSPLANLKAGAKKFIDIIEESTDGVSDGEIGSGSRIGIVSFATVARQDTQLITSVSDLKAAIDELHAEGFTNHADAFTEAVKLFDPSSANAKVIVMFTDGKTTVGGSASAITADARANGVIIYCIGLSGNDGIDEDALNDWASDPSSAYVSITPDDTALTELFEELAQNISKTGATDIVIDEQISPCFSILSVDSPNKGTASITGPGSIRWTIKELGVSSSEGAVLEFSVRHNGICSGLIPVNESITYSDNEGNVVIFPSPEIEVECDIVVKPEACPEPIDLSVNSCEESVEFDAGNIGLESMGQILQLEVTLKNVCPYKRVALAAMLAEVDEEGTEYPRGMKIMTVPAHVHPRCKDVRVKCIKFVLPEDLNVSGVSLFGCSRRHYKARFIAHYVDSDIACCPIN